MMNETMYSVQVKACGRYDVDEERRKDENAEQQDETEEGGGEEWVGREKEEGGEGGEGHMWSDILNRGTRMRRLFVIMFL